MQGDDVDKEIREALGYEDDPCDDQSALIPALVVFLIFILGGLFIVAVLS